MHKLSLEAHTKTTKHRILLVEDDSIVGPVVQEILWKAGYKVALKADLEGVKTLDNYDFSAVITDFQLPTGDGCDVIEFMRSKKPGIPAMVMSGHGNWTANHCANRGVKGVSLLEKPFKAKDLLDAVNALVLAEIMLPLLTKP
jgi:DNA-binding NtrC family response regulator